MTRPAPLAALALALLVAVAAAAETPRDVRIVVDPGARLRSSASATSRQVARLEPGAALLVLESGARTEMIGGVTAPWLRVRDAAGTEGWVFGGWLSRPAPGGTFHRADLPSDEAWEAYLDLALRRGERVRAVDDFEGIAAGEEGWFFSRSVEGEPPFLIVWDRDLDATPADWAMPGDFPRILADRTYFLYATGFEAVGSPRTADFSVLALDWVRERLGEFEPGTEVTLGRHAAVSDEEDSANWNESMEEYVGGGTVIVELEGEDPWGRPTARVELDGGEWSWRIENMILGAAEGGDEGGEAWDGEGGESGGYGEESYGMIGVGTLVVLGRHDDLAWDANWNEDMEPFVGMEARVTELVGADSDGFLGVRVEGNDWFWRVRNLAVSGRGEPGGYGYEVGDEVILGRHRALAGDENWADEMDDYVGMRATITGLVGLEEGDAGCFIVTVDVDEGGYVWRVETLRPAD